MAKPKAAPQPKAAPEPDESAKPERRYFIVNPAGAIHEVSREHAKERLAQVGYRMATPAEVAAYLKADGNQRVGKPLAAPHQVDPDVALDAIEAALEGEAE